MTEVQELAVLPNQIVVLAEQMGVTPAKVQQLSATFGPSFFQAEKIIAEARTVSVTDATQLKEMKKARELRLTLKEIRVATEKSRVAAKSDALKEGQAIDKVAGYIKGIIEPVEAELENAEKFAERAQAAREAKLKAEREQALAPYTIDTAAFNLGAMEEAAFATLFNGFKLAHEAKIEAERKAEAERVAAEAARVAEEKRIREENARLEALAAEREAALKAEREAAAKAQREADEKARIAREEAAAAARAAQAKADAEKAAIEAKAKDEREEAARVAKVEADRLAEVARKEREAREKLEAENKAREEAEAKRVADEKLAARKAAQAPDREKLMAFAATVRAMEVPIVSSEDAKRVAAEIALKVAGFALWIETQTKGLA